jgi:hypothetical protein
MTEMIFADTFYWEALLSPRDAFHNQAFAITAKLGKTKVANAGERQSKRGNFFTEKSSGTKAGKERKVKSYIGELKLKSKRRNCNYHGNSGRNEY